jgi:drug/metabolite transporter (DMT)-like permease
LATALWGAAFLVTHIAMARVQPLPFLALRFCVAAVAIRLLTGARLGRVSRTELRGGALIGLAMLAGYALQAVALGRLGSGRVAFICALYVPMVPLLQAALTGRLPGGRTWLSIGLACGGMMLLAGGTGAGLGRGEAFALASAWALPAKSCSWPILRRALIHGGWPSWNVPWCPRWRCFCRLGWDSACRRSSRFGLRARCSWAARARCCR